MLSGEQLEIAHENMGEHGLFVYDGQAMVDNAQEFLNAESQMPFGMTTRYAVKANHEPKIVGLFNSMGLHFDTASIEETTMLLDMGVDGSKISLSSQRLRHTPVLEAALEQGVSAVATSGDMFKRLSGASDDKNIPVRINPGKGGSGHTAGTIVAGSESTFGIYVDQIEDIKREGVKQGVTIDRIHIHIGSGAEPSAEYWRSVINTGLNIIEQFPDATTLDIGGGYKISRMPEEEASDMDKIFEVFADSLDKFHQETGREIKLEVEPGTKLVGSAGDYLA